MTHASDARVQRMRPLPPKRLAEFAAGMDACYVIEEASDYFSLRVRALGIELAITD